MQLVLIQSSDFWGGGRGWGVRERKVSSLYPPGRIWSVSRSELYSILPGMKRFWRKQAQKIKISPLVDWGWGGGIWLIPTHGAPWPFGAYLFVLFMFCLFFKDMFFLMGLEVDSYLCSAGLTILISSIIDLCNGENIWTVAFFILVTCDAIKWR